MSLYDAVMFDFDGVLADTEPVHFACWRDTLAPSGIALDWSVYERDCIGISDVEMLGFLASLAEPPLGPDAMRACYARKQELFRRITADGRAIPAEIRQMLRSLDRWRLAVVSSSASADVETPLASAGLRPLFGALVCREHVARHKPAPDPYLKRPACSAPAGRWWSRTPLPVSPARVPPASTWFL